MKTFRMLWWIVACVVSSCHSRTEVFPTEEWSEGCVELAPYQGEYRLSGMCCAYAILPSIRKAPNGSFKVNGKYYTFTGAGYDSIPIEITGELISNHTLTLGYSIGSQKKEHRLKPGRATMSCYCGCF